MHLIYVHVRLTRSLNKNVYVFPCCTRPNIRRFFSLIIRATLCLRPIRPWPWGATALGGAKFVFSENFWFCCVTTTQKKRKFIHVLIEKFRGTIYLLALGALEHKDGPAYNGVTIWNALFQ